MWLRLITIWFLQKIICIVEGLTSENYVTTEKLIKMYQYPIEKHFTISPDGFEICTFRIPTSPFGPPFKQRLPVLLVPGLFLSSEVFVDNTRAKSLAFILVDHGYDVWLTNIRGTTNSQNHLRYSFTDPVYWDFSFQESAVFDLPTLIDYILEKTGARKLFYIGYSLGSTIGFMMLFALPQYNEKIFAMMNMAPVATVHHINLDLTKETLRNILIHVLKNPKVPLNPSSPKAFLPKIHENCQRRLFWRRKCLLGFGMHTGDIVGNMNASRLNIYFHNIPEPTSMRTLYHLLQIYRSQKLQMYDYENIAKNQQMYNQPHPPEVNLTRITVPVILLTSSQDFVANSLDVAILKSKFQNLELFDEIHLKGFGHFCFLWGFDASRLVYIKILDYLNRHTHYELFHRPFSSKVLNHH